MKKILQCTIASFAIITAANAAQIQWGVTGNTILWVPVVNNDTGALVNSANRLGDATVLFFLYSDSIMNEGAFDNDFLKSLSGGLSSVQSNYGSILLSHAISNPAGGVATTNVPDRSDLIRGVDTDFFMVALFNSGNPSEGFWFNISSTVTQKPYVPPGDTATIAVFNNNSPMNGWQKYVIPEPTTAGLALAGLALLFRRKRK